MDQALACCRPDGTVGFVGVPHGISLSGEQMFFAQKRMFGGPAPVRRFLHDLMARVLNGELRPGHVFDMDIPLSQVAEGYKAMDERRAIKVILRPWSCPPSGTSRMAVSGRKDPFALTPVACGAG